MRLEAERLSARRGEDLIFNDISFTLESGEALVVTGRNGVGKSTLLRALAGLLPLESGQVWLTETRDEPRSFASACHYLGHRNAMKRELTLLENLIFWQRFMAADSADLRSSAAQAAERVGLSDIVHLPFGTLSQGQQRRAAMAKLLLVHRPVWLLDEPTAALDTSAEAMFADLMNEHTQEGGILIAATHQALGITNARQLAMTGFSGAEDAA